MYTKLSTLIDNYTEYRLLNPVSWKQFISDFETILKDNFQNIQINPGSYLIEGVKYIDIKMLALNGSKDFYKQLKKAYEMCVDGRHYIEQYLIAHSFKYKKNYKEKIVFDFCVMDDNKKIKSAIFYVDFGLEDEDFDEQKSYCEKYNIPFIIINYHDDNHVDRLLDNFLSQQK